MPTSPRCWARTRSRFYGFDRTALTPIAARIGPARAPTSTPPRNDTRETDHGKLLRFSRSLRLVRGVSLSRELAPGEVKPLQYFGKELGCFAPRARGPPARRVLPHLGAHLGYGGKVKGEHIACPFHAWEFNGEGVCKHIPYREEHSAARRRQADRPRLPGGGAQPDHLGLVPPERIAPTFEVELVPGGGPPGLDRKYRVYEWKFGAPIQEAAENAADAAHFRLSCHTSKEIPRGEIHARGAQALCALRRQGADMDEHGNHRPHRHALARQPARDRELRPGQTLQRFMGLFDTIQLGLPTPIDSETMHLRFCFIQRKDMNATQQMMARGPDRRDLAPGRRTCPCAG